MPSQLLSTRSQTSVAPGWIADPVLVSLQSPPTATYPVGATHAVTVSAIVPYPSWSPSK
jgi:hypothetical protein